MLLYVLDPNLSVTYIIDNYSSVIWVERYNTIGDAEIVLPYIYEKESWLEVGTLLASNSHSSIMVICDIDYNLSSPEESPGITIRAFDFSHYLKWRVVTSTSRFRGNGTIEVEKLVYDNMVNSVEEARNIPILTTQRIVDGVGYPALNGPVTAEFPPSSLYEIVEQVTKAAGYGFRVYLHESELGRMLVFEVYSGYDRTQNQTQNQRVIFSRKYDNLISGSEYISSSDYRNLTYIIPKEELGFDTASHWLMDDEPTGLGRKEMLLMTNQGLDDGEGGEITEEEFWVIVTEEATKGLKDRNIKLVFECTTSVSGVFSPNVDYFIGDIVMVDIGLYVSRVLEGRVTELMTSHDEEGFKTIISIDLGELV